MSKYLAKLPVQNIIFFMNKALLLLSILLHLYLFAHSQSTEVAKITVDAGSYDRDNSLVYAGLDGIDLDLANRELVLYRIAGNGEEKVVSQLDMSDPPKNMVEAIGKSCCREIPKIFLEIGARQ